MLALTLVGVGQGVIFAAGVVTAVGVLAKTKPARWLWRRNVAEPLRAELRRVVGDVVDEKLAARPLTNGWGQAAVQAIAEATGAQVEPPRTDPDEEEPPTP